MMEQHYTIMGHHPTRGWEHFTTVRAGAMAMAVALTDSTLDRARIYALGHYGYVESATAREWFDVGRTKLKQLMCECSELFNTDEGNMQCTVCDKVFVRREGPRHG